MQSVDLRVYKSELRADKRMQRKSIDPEIKRSLDKGITHNVRKLYQYRSCDTVMSYVSTSIEVNTETIIKNAWADGKKVAVPRCIPGTKNMEFYYIDSFDDLEKGSFSLLEPKVELPKAPTGENCLMLVPAFMTDYSGYRLGYGMGYYDRYMSGFSGSSAVLCYSSDVCGSLKHGRYDRRSDVIVTEKWIRTVTSNKRFYEKRRAVSMSPNGDFYGK